MQPPPRPTASAIRGYCVLAVQESLVSEEIVHDLDTCEVTVDGEDLNPAQESLEVDTARLQQKGIAVSGSDLGMVFTGECGSRRRLLSPSSGGPGGSGEGEAHRDPWGLHVLSQQEGKSGTRWPAPQRGTDVPAHLRFSPTAGKPQCAHVWSRRPCA